MAAATTIKSPVHWVERAVAAATASGPVTVTGARDDGTALASLLTAVESLGLIVDDSTAT